MNTKATRISVATAHGAPLDTSVGPAPELVGDENPAAYRAIKYRDYIHFQQSNELDRRVLLASYSDLKQNSLGSIASIHYLYLNYYACVSTFTF